MPRVYASNGGFRRPGMHGAMGLFGSQGKPGMMASSSLGSLGGNSLGIPSGAITQFGDSLSEPRGQVSSIGADDPGIVAPSVVPAASAPMTTQTKVLIGVGLLAAYWMFLRKK